MIVHRSPFGPGDVKFAFRLLKGYTDTNPENVDPLFRIQLNHVFAAADRPYLNRNLMHEYTFVIEHDMFVTFLEQGIAILEGLSGEPRYTNMCKYYLGVLESFLFESNSVIREKA